MRKEFVKAAIVGTDHYSANTAAQDLLQRVVVYQMQKQASYIPQKTHYVLPQTAPLDNRCLCDEQLLQQFWSLCNHRSYYSLRSVWAEKFAQAGWQLPNELMPIIEEHFELEYQDLEALFGKRFKWFLNASGRYKSFDMPAWRPVHDFVKIRQQNPNSAREWLIENWSKFDHVQQHDYLTAMENNLCEEDIPFLTQVFRSSNIEVRPHIYKAAVLLSLLHAEVLQPLVEQVLDLTRFQYLANKRLPVLDFQWSDMFTDLPIYRNDALPKNIVGWLSKLTQLIGLVPIDKWYQQWQLSFEELLEAAYNGTDTDIFFVGWHSRIIAEKHQGFAAAMLAFVRNRRYMEVRLRKESLLKFLSFEQVQDYIEEQLQNDKMNG